MNRDLAKTRSWVKAFISLLPGNNTVEIICNIALNT